MKVAVIGSRNIKIDRLEQYLPPDTTEIVSGGARGVDTCAREYALAHGIPLREFLPDYARYHRGAPLVRNRELITYADMVIVFWDGESRGTAYSIDYCRKIGRPISVYHIGK